MKKVFFIGLAAATLLVSCNNDETLEMAQSKAIGFSNAFVNNGTRSFVDPSFTTGTLEDFVVYGFTQNGQIFHGDKVYKASTATGWKYDNQQFWVAGNTYTFGAIAPFSVKSNISNVTLPTGGVKVEMKVTDFTTSDESQVDLLHAAPTQISGTDVTTTYSTPVGLTFNHQLSKVRFSFENEVGVDYNIKVTDIKINNAYKQGTLNVGTTKNTWSNHKDNTLVLNFGHIVANDATTNTAAIIANATTLESYNEKLIIPHDNTASYNVTFTVELYKGTVLLGTYNHSSTITGVEFKLGYCYDFKATLTPTTVTPDPTALKPIEFTVTSIKDWNKTNEEQSLNVSTGIGA